MHHIVFDLEMNIWDKPIFKNNNGYYVYNKRKKIYIQSGIQEVIEIGAVKLNDDFNVIETFQTFVKPVFNPNIGKRCSALTHISQEDVDNEREFHKCINQFAAWIAESQEFNLYSWSDNDKLQILRECKEKNITSSINSMLKKHFIDLQKQYALLCGRAPHELISLKNAAESLQIPFIQHHRALEDAYIAANILAEILGIWKDRIGNKT